MSLVPYNLREGREIVLYVSALALHMLAILSSGQFLKSLTFIQVINIC